MIRIWGPPVLAAMILCGCQTTAEQTADPIGWGRIDCQRIVPGSPIQTQFEQAKLVCVNRAQAAGVAGTAAMPVGYGLGGAIASGINAGIASAQIQDATTKSCMAEYGFMMSRKSEFEARCPVVIPPTSTPAPSPKSAGRSTRRAKTAEVAAPAPVSAVAPAVQYEPQPTFSEADRDQINRATDADPAYNYGRQ